VRAGDLVVVNWRLGRLIRPERRYRTDGWVTEEYDMAADPSRGTMPHWISEHNIEQAQLGTTVCPFPWLTHFCGLVHVTPDHLKALRRQEARLRAEVKESAGAR
jgi:hypothetical protein